MDNLGLVETRTITAGIRIMDVMLKAADVSLLRGTSICSGHYMIQVTGSRDAVETSINMAQESDSDLVADFILSRVSPQVLTALKEQTQIDSGSALGLVEARRAVCGIAAADAAVKQADVVIARIAVANGINGKSYLVVSGRVSSVNEAVHTASGLLGKDLMDVVVLPNPHPGVIRALVPAACPLSTPQGLGSSIVLTQSASSDSVSSDKECRGY
jgi:microcompartment protein CcmL/EutN